MACLEGLMGHTVEDLSAPSEQEVCICPFKVSETELGLRPSIKDSTSPHQHHEGDALC